MSKAVDALRAQRAYDAERRRTVAAVVEVPPERAAELRIEPQRAEGVRFWLSEKEVELLLGVLHEWVRSHYDDYDNREDRATRLQWLTYRLEFASDLLGPAGALPASSLP